MENFSLVDEDDDADGRSAVAADDQVKDRKDQTKALALVAKSEVAKQLQGHRSDQAVVKVEAFEVDKDAPESTAVVKAPEAAVVEAVEEVFEALLPEVDHNRVVEAPKVVESVAAETLEVVDVVVAPEVAPGPASTRPTVSNRDPPRPLKDSVSGCAR